MTKQELIDEIHADMHEKGMNVSKKVVKGVVDGTIDGISKCMQKGDEILLMPLGRFTTKYRNERKATNLVTGEKIAVPARYVPHFAPSSQLKGGVAELKQAGE
jgi:integration host factor subunit beta